MKRMRSVYLIVIMGILVFSTLPVYAESNPPPGYAFGVQVSPGDVVEVSGWWLHGVSNSCYLIGGFWSDMTVEAGNFSINYVVPGAFKGAWQDVNGEVYIADRAGFGLNPGDYSPWVYPRGSAYSLINETYGFKLTIYDTKVSAVDTPYGPWKASHAAYYYKAVVTWQVGSWSGSKTVYLPESNAYWLRIAFIGLQSGAKNSCPATWWWYGLEVNGEEARVAHDLLSVTAPEHVVIRQGDRTSFTIEVTSPSRVLYTVSIYLRTQQGAYKLTDTPAKPWGPDGPTVWLDPASDRNMADDGVARLVVHVDASSARPGSYTANVDLYAGGVKLLDAPVNLTGTAYLASIQLEPSQAGGLASLATKALAGAGLAAIAIVVLMIARGARK